MDFPKKAKVVLVRTWWLVVEIQELRAINTQIWFFKSSRTVSIKPMACNLYPLIKLDLFVLEVDNHAWARETEQRLQTMLTPLKYCWCHHRMLSSKRTSLSSLTMLLVQLTSNNNRWDLQPTARLKTNKTSITLLQVKLMLIFRRKARVATLANFWLLPNKLSYKRFKLL